MFDWFYRAEGAVLYLSTMVLIAGAAELGAWLARRSRDGVASDAPIGTVVGAALGLLALLLGFSFSLVLSRFEARSNLCWTRPMRSAAPPTSR